MSRDTGRMGGTSQEVEAPAPAAPAPVPETAADLEAVAVAALDAGSAPEAPALSVDEVEAEPEPLAPEGLAVAACTRARAGCVTLYISVADADAQSCLQLTLDDCGDTTRPGLRVTVPLSWRLGSGFVATLGDACVPGTPFEANNFTIGSGSGSIHWNQETRQPSEIVIDVTLQPLGTENPNEPIRVSNGDLVDPLLECDN